MNENSKVNPLPPHRFGLWRVRVVPYPYKECWPGAPFGNRWRALKARLRVKVSAGAGAAGREA